MHCAFFFASNQDPQPPLNPEFMDYIWKNSIALGMGIYTHGLWNFSEGFQQVTGEDLKKDFKKKYGVLEAKI